MATRTERRLIGGLVGHIEVALDWPAQAPAGVAIVGHPHPLYGGTLDNKVTATLARAFSASGWLAVRPNFRGVGRTEGAHDHGDGELDDFVHLIDTLPQWLASEVTVSLPLALAGFSFGSRVAARAAQRLQARGQRPALLVLVGAAAGKMDMPPVPSDTLVIHGEQDETIPLAGVLDWARPLDLPVVVLPGADHFFHRRLSTLKRLVQMQLAARKSIDALGPAD